ncbi:hypothetical protein [Acinetobacter rudis]|uniref:hypothetical protein n=1 Tax=Acinetobacter rudis TaxID=632955 RepID=UPI003340CACA
MTEDQKMQMAHEMAVAMQSVEPITDMTLLATLCFQYADAMQAEAYKRGRQRISKALEIHKVMHPNGSKHFDDVYQELGPIDKLGFKMNVDVPEAILEAERK